MTAYKGEKQWAPCFHGATAKQHTAEYVAGVLARPQSDDIPQYAGAPVDLEALLWALGLGWYWGEQAADVTDLKFGFYADQWVGVSVEVHRQDGSVDYLWTEADTFTLALAKSLERLKQRGVWTPGTDNQADVS